jgi:hypothetical protein
MRAVVRLCREHFPVDQVEAAGVHECGLADTTGIQLPALFAARTPLQEGLPGEPLHGMTPKAGLPMGWLLA